MSKFKAKQVYPPMMIEENEFLTGPEMKEVAKASEGALMVLTDGKKDFLVRRDEWIDYCNAKGWKK